MNDKFSELALISENNNNISVQNILVYNLN